MPLRAAPRPLAGRVVAITGGARGIGRETARRLLARGARVAVGDLDGELASLAVAGFEGGVGLDVDVTDRASFARFLEQVEAALGPVDVLVNNAGIMPVGPFVDEPDDVTRRQIAVNVEGVILGMKLALPGMLARGRGHLVNLGSAASLVGLPGEAVYCATKHAVLGLSEAVRTEVRGRGIDVTVVMPNLAATELGSGMSNARFTPMLTPEQVAEAIVGVIERPRFEVPIRRDVGPMLKFRRMLPMPARDAVDRLFGTDRVGTDVSDAGRAAYRAKIAAEAARSNGG